MSDARELLKRARSVVKAAAAPPRAAPAAVPPGARIIKRYKTKPSTPARTSAAPVAKSKPKPLYVCRAVLNADEIIAWARGQGFASTLPADDMHVTVAFSRQPINWHAVGDDYHCEPSAGLGGGPVADATSADRVARRLEGGPREVREIGDKGAVALFFDSVSLTQRWCQLRGLGASWDYPGYQPHITITYDRGKLSLDEVEPYTGAILLGEEDWREIDDDWDEKIEEASVDKIARRQIGEVSDAVKRLAREFDERRRA